MAPEEGTLSMPTFAYRAINESGRPVHGFVEADSAAEARQLIAQQGLIPGRIHLGQSGGARRRPGVGFAWIAIKARDLILFTKQFATMIRAGVPILRSFDILEQQTENARLKKTVAVMAKDVREGASLYDAVRMHPRAFNDLYASMIQAGEASGALPEVMERLIYIMEHENKVKSDIRQAVQYPILVLVCLAVAFFVLLTLVVPRFAGIFVAANIPLPMPTQICLELSGFLIDRWYLAVGALVILVSGLTLYFRTAQGRLARDATLLRMPLLGNVFQKAAISRFASILGILQSTGVGILDSMHIVSGTIGNVAIAAQLHRIEEMLREGRGIARPLMSSKYFTPMLVNMVAIGEEAGSLDVMLQEVSKHYDTEVEYAMKQMSEMLGPVLIVLLAGMVGFFALAIYLPMWDLTKLVQ